MQEAQNAPDGGKIALRYGLIWGLILAAADAVIQVVKVIINNAALAAVTSSTPTGTSPTAGLGIVLVLNGIGFLLGLAAYFMAGIQAASKTGKIPTGLLAGLWTGLFYGVIGFIISEVIFFTVTLPQLEALSNMIGSSGEVYRTSAIIGGVGGAALGVVWAIGLGVGLGALGGLIGKNNTKVAPTPSTYPHYPPNLSQPYGDPYSVQGQPLQVPPYPGQPYPGQPTPQQYPPQPYADPYQPPSPYTSYPEGGPPAPPPYHP